MNAGPDRHREPRLDVGTIVAAGRYRIVSEIGAGGMAIVYAATDLRTETDVALKVVLSRYAHKADTAARYDNEVRLAAAIGRHPHVVHPLDVGRLPEYGDRPYLATDLVRGTALGTMVLENPRGMKVSLVVRVGRDIARALRALHTRGIVHRDIKPSNIMLDEEAPIPIAKLLDFGCAYATGRGEVEASADLTLAHERIGTAIYMSPEQAIGVRPIPAFDIYAFGATLYELLTGAAPYAGSPNAEVVRRKCALDDPPRPVARLRSELPPALATLVDQCLAREVVDRPTASTVLNRLETIASDLGLVGARPRAAMAIVVAPEVDSGTAMIARPTADRSALDPSPAPVVPAPAAPRSGAHRRAASPTRWPRVALGVLGLGGLVAAIALRANASDPPATPPETGPSTSPTSQAGPASPPVPPAHAASVDSAVGAHARPAVAPPSLEENSAQTDTIPPVDTDASGGETEGPTSAGPRPSAATGPRDEPPAPPRWTTPKCTAVRAQATRDRTARSWSALLQAVTHERGCWKARDERMVLHLHALTGLGRYDECVDLAAESRNRELRRMAKQCEHKKER